MSLPSPALSVPTLTNDQMGYQGVVIGAPPATPFGITQIEGLMKPQVRSGNSDRPRARGAFVGLNLLKTRTITATMDVGPPFGSYSNLPGAVSALDTASVTEGSTEYPLWIQLPNFPLVACMARVLNKDLKWNVVSDLGSLVQGATMQWEACDPYFYSAPTISTTIGLPTPGVGFTFPITFNWSFGGGSTANMATITNNGNVPCWPVLVITGPCVNPTVANLSVAGSPTLQLNATLNTGDQLIVDCDLQTIVFIPSGSTVGSPQPQILMPGSSFFACPPGSSVISFNSQDTSPAAGTLAVWSASAYDGLL
jgi:hypothetical protein